MSEVLPRIRAESPVRRVPRSFRRAGAALRPHAPFLVALAGAALLRWTALRAYPGVLWFTGDSYFYIGYAMRLSPSAGKSVGYPMLLRLLEPWHSLVLVAAVQHLLGLATAVLGYLLLRRARVPGALATLALLPVLYDAYQVELEHLLMSETAYTFLLAAGLALLLWRPLGEGRPAPWWAALAAGLLIGYAVLVRTAGIPLVPLAAVLLLARRGGWRPALAFAAAVAVPVVAYASWFHAVNDGYGLTRSDGLFLWGRVAPFADCAEIGPPAWEEPLCLPAELHVDADAPGRLIWRTDIPPRQIYENPQAPFANETLRDFSVRAILAQPGDYASVVGEGLRMAFTTAREPYPTAPTETLYHFPRSPAAFPGGRSWGPDENSTVLLDAAAYERGLNLSTVVEPYAGRMRAYQARWHLPGPWLAALFATGAVGVLTGRGRRPELLLVWAAAATLLVFPIASADFDYRYVLPAVPFACVAAGLAFHRGLPGARPLPVLLPARRAVPAWAGRLTRWSGTPGSPRRGRGPASAP
ncbi:hypothetical protein [Actinomadura parmotrematis]|uniref:Phospholipid carrier-dependent glycosyltransferase n=1 Tax=Actinomadura parmotrematis TaxID=2864039 RepID=A0ABS7G2D0_9ACTN|nr:hypothetical protein [Actinomadura parmotrematis]MBW8485982.1 hypothetical protein [Actinomadura parmotrematis]